MSGAVSALREPTEPSDAGERLRRQAKAKRFRMIVGITLATVFAVAYVLVVTSYRSGFDAAFTEPTPPKNGVALVFTPIDVDARARTATGELLVFLAPELLDGEGKSKVAIDVEIHPALSGNPITIAAGQLPSPVSVTLPAPGVVQRYPYDTYEIAFATRASSTLGESAKVSIPTASSVFFMVPGWHFQAAQSGDVSMSESVVIGSVDRAGSTKMVAVLMLVLMVCLAVIAVMVVQSTATGKMRLELSVASWITAMLFALLPIRGFLPGDPPVGSWIDVLVFFWVEATIMVCVALAAIGLLMRSRSQQKR